MSQEKNINLSKFSEDHRYFDRIQDLCIETFQLYLENVVHLRNMIYHGKSYFEFKFINFQKFQEYDRSIKEDFFSLFLILIRLKAPNEYEELISVVDACLKIRSYYFIFNNWINTEANKLLIERYGINTINKIIEIHKKLCNMIINYGFDITFQAMQTIIYSNQLNNEKNNNLDEIYKRMEELIKATKWFDSFINNQNKN